MRYEVVILDDAVEQINNIRNYITYELGNPFAADNTARKIYARIASLGLMPYCNPLGNNRYRVHIKHFTIFYVIIDHVVYVTTIVYSRRNILF